MPIMQIFLRSSGLVHAAPGMEPGKEGEGGSDKV